MRRRLTALVLALLLPGLPVHADTPAPDDRLAQLGKLWGMVRYLHPYIPTRDVDWDAALLTALPKVGEAPTVDAYRAAVQEMLSALGDPVTAVIPKPPARASSQGPAAAVPLFREAAGGVLVIDVARHLTGGAPNDTVPGAMRTIPERLKHASAVVVDLRAGTMTDDEQSMTWMVIEQVAPSLVSRPVRAPSGRYLQHAGYRPHVGGGASVYNSSVVLHAADTYEPLPGSSAKKVVFVLDARTWVPPIVHALANSGDAHVVTEGEVTDAYIADSRTVDIGGGLSVRVRINEMQGGWSGAHANVVVEEGAGGRAVDAAIVEAGKTWSRPDVASTASLPPPVFRPDRAYEDMIEPDLPHRQLAVIRAWNVIHYFYPYKDLIGDWDPVLPTFLAKMEDARSSRDYALTMAEMMAHVADGHTTLTGRPDMEKPFGEVGLPIQVRWIERQPVVSRVSDAASKAGLEVGDAIQAIDDEAVDARVGRISRYVTASTRSSLLYRLAGRHLLAGPTGSTARLTAQKVDGQVREVSLVRDPKAALSPLDTGEVVRILPGNLGYVDLPRLTPADVDAMFVRLKDTRGIVFDLRGYPQGTAWAIAPRINILKAKYGAQIRRPQVSAMSAEENDVVTYFSQPLPPLPEGATMYECPTVTIIDDRAGSQAEHTGLFFEAANGTTFVGTPTAGTNGNVTRFPVPGGISITFTGVDVRHADGRQLQRVGILPHVEAAPTREGLKAGVDEVLAKAVATLEQKIAGYVPVRPTASPVVLP